MSQFRFILQPYRNPGSRHCCRNVIAHIRLSAISTPKKRLSFPTVWDAVTVSRNAAITTLRNNTLPTIP